MGVSSERLNLLLFAFALFFTCVHGPERRHQSPATPLDFAGIFSFEEAAAGADNGNPEARQELREGAATVETLTRVGFLTESRLASRSLADAREGRLVAFCDTPPPKAA